MKYYSVAVPKGTKRESIDRYAKIYGDEHGVTIDTSMPIHSEIQGNYVCLAFRYE